MPESMNALDALQTARCDWPRPFLFSRRALAPAAIGLVSSLALSQPAPMHFVLVPGAWHGRWAFDALAKALAALGHSSTAVCLTGVGERAAESSAEVTLQTHIDDVIAELNGTTKPTALLGHSYAGMVITGSALQCHTKPQRLVYLDAFVPQPGDSFFSLMKPAYVASWRVKSEGLSAVPPMLSGKHLGIANISLARQVESRLTPHPLHSFDTPLSFDVGAWQSMAKTFIRCTRNPSFGPMAEKARRLGCTLRTIDAGHDAMLTVPAALAALLHDIAQ